MQEVTQEPQVGLDYVSIHDGLDDGNFSIPTVVNLESGSLIVTLDDDKEEI
jgi:hypothetical protein